MYWLGSSDAVEFLAGRREGVDERKRHLTELAVMDKMDA